jgi:hypothetical protein
MELWIWLTAFGLGLLIPILALTWLASRGVILLKKLKPFADQVAKFSKDAKQYPEAVKFYSELAQPEQTPAKKLESPKANER